MGEGQLESVADLLDLGAEAPDVVPGDVGGFGDDELLDTRAFDQGRGQAGPQVRGQRVAGAEGLGVQAAGQVEDAGGSAAGRD